MKYILNENIALRSWWLVPYAYYIKHQKDAQGLKKEQFEILLQCDGQTELEDSEPLQELIAHGFCRIAYEGEQLTRWQRYKKCNNRYFPAMNWMITDKCNFNCLHCFNAADNCRMFDEYSMEEARVLLEQAEACGINGFTITGGEPMLHPHFMDIVRGIYDHGMYIFELNTNGHFLTQKILDEMKEIGCMPLIKISFDGVGHHDWLRQREGAEAEALAAMRLCIQNGFRVKAQVQLNRKNKDSMLATAKLLDELGVAEMRVIRTSESPRWAENAGDACMSFEEYFDTALALWSEYCREPHRMALTVWLFADVYPKSKTYSVRACGHSFCYRDSLPVCGGNRSMIAVAADGNLYPCHQSSGYYRMKNDVLGNVKKDGLETALQQGKYLNEICTTLGDLKNANSECAACKYFPYCLGGCRAMGIMFDGKKTGTDRSKCLLYKGQYIKKLAQTLPGYTTYDILPEELQPDCK